MNISQYIWVDDEWQIQAANDVLPAMSPQIILIFGARERLSEPTYFNKMQALYPEANIAICSTSGEILGTSVYDGTIVATAMTFEKTDVRVEAFEIKKIEDSKSCGKKIAETFDDPALKGILLLTDGQMVNGSEFLLGVNDVIKGRIPVTGGMAGDADRFEKTLVGLNQMPESGQVVVIGLYGDHIKIGHGSQGGWDTFGPEREVTRSTQNVLFELDHTSALDLYKQYLGDRASELPGSALLFPLLLKNDEHPDGVVRTILAVSDEDKSMTFAGNLPEGSTVKLMKANFDRLIDGSVSAAEESVSIGEENPDIAILISCVGRKLVLGQLTGEEVEEAARKIGKSTAYTGFYSYGELSPVDGRSTCHLHNQTMTITTLKEV